MPLFGLDRELADKAAAKFDPEREREAVKWIQDVTGAQFTTSFQETLKDGTLLCQLIQKLAPSESNLKYKKSPMPFVQMEQINTFLKAAGRLGVPDQELFMTIDLYEGKNLPQVIDSLYSLSRHASSKGFSGPQLGPKLHTSHSVEFTPEQMNAGKNIIGLQAGFNGGANQSGISFGATRQLVTENASKPIDTSTIPAQAGFVGGAKSGVAFGARREIGGADPARR
ncbi:hypothetical protein SmJEL517_g00866 [Synchytrium microbalum]|uniref:Calponin-homology (CH) domain-containing protein n=1 Tax=Synchytrium microbalum TaxID=1806994 RepID=A0A507CGF4_9FUNG|nr:uncharacterized protein SmJEL517_g00866 [Synchytrium microbalum]TPX37054.1 hypothetical protein SmJEL517_g00866 [Synchytrium microbalum]